MSALGLGRIVLWRAGVEVFHGLCGAACWFWELSFWFRFLLRCYGGLRAGLIVVWRQSLCMLHC